MARPPGGVNRPARLGACQYFQMARKRLAISGSQKILSPQIWSAPDQPGQKLTRASVHVLLADRRLPAAGPLIASDKGKQP